MKRFLEFLEDMGLPWIFWFILFLASVVTLGAQQYVISNLKIECVERGIAHYNSAGNFEFDKK